MRRAAGAALAAVAVAAALAGCGERDEPEPAATPAETRDPLPDLPRKWSRHVNGRAGFAVGLPPGWSARDRRRSSLLRSPNELAAVTISADRTRGGLALPLDEFATRVADALKGFRRLKTESPRPFDARYDAVAVSGSGEAKGGVRQRLLVVVERRAGLATYTAVVATNATRAAGRHRDEIRRILRSVRGRPVKRSGR
jgi:hypothetical protein